jgi:hypothetical protein
MESQRPLEKRPLWVKVMLWGVSDRAEALLFFWLWVVAAVAPIFFAFWNPIPVVAIVMLFWFPGMMSLALWFRLAIRWVDKYGSWPPRRGSAGREK